MPIYQFVPGIPFVEHSGPLTQRHFDRLKHVHPGAGRSVDLAFGASSSLKALYRPWCCGVGQALGGEPVHCKEGQMSVEQSASETAADVVSSHSWPTTGWAFLFPVGVKHLTLIGFGGREWGVASPACKLFVLRVGTHNERVLLRCGLLSLLYCASMRSLRTAWIPVTRDALCPL